jgi:hypothetical protein
MSSYECSTDDGASGNDPAKWRKSCLCHCYKGKFFVLKPATATDTVSSLARSISSCGCVIQAASRHSGGDAALFLCPSFSSMVRQAGMSSRHLCVLRSRRQICCIFPRSPTNGSRRFELLMSFQATTRGGQYEDATISFELAQWPGGATLKSSATNFGGT